MTFDLEVNIKAITVFLQGVLSFFSPCVLPLLPVYIGYLSGGAYKKTEEGDIIYDRKKVILHTIFFVIGISFAFLLLALGASAIGRFFTGNQMLFVRIGGLLIFLFGLYQLGFLGQSRILNRELRLDIPLNEKSMSPLIALIMGFAFSFAWTPCVGPALSSVLILTASEANRMRGFLYILVYTLGFTMPFLLTGLFTTQLLNLFRKHRSFVRYTEKVAGVLMLFIGFLMITGGMNSLSSSLASLSGNTANDTTAAGTQMEEEALRTNEAEGDIVETLSEADGDKSEEIEETGERIEPSAVEESVSENAEQGDTLAALDFTLTDQYGNVHSLSDYKGKTIFLNFWATWCPPCRQEMPDIQALYEKSSTEGEDAVIVLGVAAPNLGQEGSISEIQDFLEENGYSYPVLMDTDYSLFFGYGIYSYPTTFMIDRDGNVFGYVSGMITADMMDSIVEQTLKGEYTG